MCGLPSWPALHRWLTTLAGHPTEGSLPRLRVLVLHLRLSRRASPEGEGRSPVSLLKSKLKLMRREPGRREDGQREVGRPKERTSIARWKGTGRWTGLGGPSRTCASRRESRRPSLLTSVVRRALLLLGSLRECLHGREMVRLRQKQAGDRRREVNSPGARVWATRPAALWRSDMRAIWVNEGVRVSDASWVNVLEVSPSLSILSSASSAGASESWPLRRRRPPFSPRLRSRSDEKRGNLPSFLPFLPSSLSLVLSPRLPLSLASSANPSADFGHPGLPI